MAVNIMALIDFSPVCDRIVKHAGKLSGLYGAKCWLVHVADPDPDFVGYKAGPQYVRDHKAAKLHKEHIQLQDYKKELEQTGIMCEALLIQGQINPTIIKEIKKLEIDLVVLGSHGHTRLYDLVVGSVSEFLLKKHIVPLFIIPSRKQ